MKLTIETEYCEKHYEFYEIEFVELEAIFENKTIPNTSDSVWCGLELAGLNNEIEFKNAKKFYEATWLLELVEYLEENEEKEAEARYLLNDHWEQVHASELQAMLENDTWLFQGDLATYAEEEILRTNDVPSILLPHIDWESVGGNYGVDRSEYEYDGTTYVQLKV